MLPSIIRYSSTNNCHNSQIDRKKSPVRISALVETVSGAKDSSTHPEFLKTNMSRRNHSIEGPLPENFNIVKETQKMIPVRGPTLFDRQFNEFVHGVQSKSGNPATLQKLKRKKMKHESEDARKSKLDEGTESPSVIKR